MPSIYQVGTSPNGKGEVGFSREQGAYNTTSFNNNINAAEKKETRSTSEKKLESKASMDINESAEAFIKKFRQQLLIQRLDSIENYQKMLARGL